MNRTALALVFSLAFGCGNGASSSDAGRDVTEGDAGPAVPTHVGPAERPARLALPDAYDGVTPLPLVVQLHGYQSSAEAQELFFNTTSAARTMGIYVLLAEGTINSLGFHFWNATPACCDHDHSGVDDVAYLTALLDAASAVVPVDTSRVYFIGHSNGGFMSYRMACEISSRVAAIATLAGSDFIGDMDCVPTHPVSVLQVHGTDDADVLYAGSPGDYPSAHDVVVRWATRAGCDLTMSTMPPPYDFIPTTPGAETSVERWSTGCATGVEAELWTIDGAGHVPYFGLNWMPELLRWLLAHPRS